MTSRGMGAVTAIVDLYVSLLEQNEIRQLIEIGDTINRRLADPRSNRCVVDIKAGWLRTLHRMQAVAYQRAFPEIERAALVYVGPDSE